MPRTKTEASLSGNFYKKIVAFYKKHVRIYFVGFCMVWFILSIIVMLETVITNWLNPLPM